MAALLCLNAAVPADLLAQRAGTESAVWEKAQAYRDVLESKREADRSPADYKRAMDGFRAVYHEDPRSIHAAEAVHAVAELLTEMGKAQHDRHSLQAAVGQYEFLRAQYPGSSLRVSVLLAEARIEADDLHDVRAARTFYELLLKSYPRSLLAPEARAGLAALQPGASSPSSQPVSIANRGEPSPAPLARTPPEREPLIAGDPNPAQPDQISSDRPASAQQLQARVSGIRHWSTPTYTRVAIDLGAEVEYRASRVTGPDRIYFDLHGTTLSKELVGKKFTVNDGGFLKEIGAAQMSGDMTRIVLDVSDITEYSAFLLPNPYRLIIDIHGRSQAGVPDHADHARSSANGSVRTPPAAVSNNASAVPGTTAVRSANKADLAKLSDQPGRVDATPEPTSRPIVATVRPRDPASRSTDVALPNQAGAANKSQRTGTDAKKAATSGTGDRGGSSAVKVPKDVLRPKENKDIKEDGDGSKSSRTLSARAAVPDSDGQTSLVRALGLKIGRIVIDPGHGGHDSGTLGVDGLEEKEVVLDVALRVGKLLRDRLGADVIFTRTDDTFVPLETRTAIANKAQADLFLSIHANSSPDAGARGVETYYLNFTQQADALRIAARENAVSDQTIYQLSDLVKKIALKEKISESREFATDVETGLFGGLEHGNMGLKNRGVKQAPFVVLIGANMPSVLAEISFLTNPKDAKQLLQPEYRQRVAEGLYRGIAQYAGGLSGVRPALFAQRSGSN